MVHVYHLSAVDATPSKGFLSALPPLEALRMLLQAKKACGRNHRRAQRWDGRRLQPCHCCEVTKHGCWSALQMVLPRADQLGLNRHAGFPGTYLVCACCPDLVIHRLPIHSKELHSGWKGTKRRTQTKQGEPGQCSDHLPASLAQTATSPWEDVPRIAVRTPGPPGWLSTLQ